MVRLYLLHPQAPDALGNVIVPPTAVVVKQKVPYFNLKVRAVSQVPISALPFVISVTEIMYI